VIEVESNLVQETVNRSARDLIKANDPGKQDLLSGLDLRVLSRDQFESLRDLICGRKASADNRIWSGAGIFVGKGFYSLYGKW
jgi:hypothetical protein